uniref:TRP C-terminal domain-containing protein n=1 Tax=Amphimedon queenslandica TaxID=400682 RepID=A0A1X7UHV8_AMPQE
MELCLFLQWLFLSSIAFFLGNGEVFYVHPNNNSSQCPNDTTCWDINKYANNDFINNSIYYFLPGIHNLTRNINIEWGSNLTFQGKGKMRGDPHKSVMESPVAIKCIGYVTVTFGNCNNLLLSNLTIKNCGYDVDGSENGYPGLVINASSANLSYMSLQESQWIALWFIDVSDLTVYHSSFYKNVYSIDVLYNYDSPSQSLLEVNECNFTGSFVELFLILDQNVYVDIRITAVHLYDSSYGIYLLSTASLYDLQIDKLVSISCAGTLFYQRQNSAFVMDSDSPSISITDSVISESSSRAFLLNNGKVNISNCTFSNNKDSALGLVNAIVTIFGDNYFINNTGRRGAGINLIITSYIYLSPDAYLSFIDNSAEVTGGAINIDQPEVHYIHGGFVTLCFFQFLDTKNKTYFYFDNNTAGLAGTAVYGGAVDSCLLTEGLFFGRSLFLEASTFVNQPGYSVISSDPLNVCFCNDDNSPNCSIRTMNLSAFPGQKIGFIMAVVGQLKNLTTGAIDITNNNLASSYLIPAANCTMISYIFEPKDINQTDTTLKVTIQNIDVIKSAYETSVASPIINVIVLPCPKGFCLSKKVCSCEYINESVRKFQSCNPTNNSVTKQPGSNLWLNGTSECTISYSSCPFDYCNGNNTFDLSRPNRQCAFNRSGDLCGNCSDNFSLMLGSNRCGECSNAYLALIIPFAMFGIALVFLIVALNLTVTVGTINGLLFFANVIKIYQPLIPHFNAFIILSQFISWINMDFGIETCFYNGMESCGKTGLQFVFTIYLWALILLIILLSKWSMKLTRLMGNNAVPVLCTLLLLSYTKLLRTIFSIFSFDRIYELSNTKDAYTLKHVWSVDGTIDYAHGCHLALFIIGLLVLTFLVLPYTMLLLLFPLWELCRSKCTIGTTYYIKLKPFFDAYAGPYTDSFRFWPGMLLVVRIILAAVVATKAQNEEDTGVAPLGLLVAVVVILLTALHLKVVYKNPKLNALDQFFLICLLITTVVIYVSKNPNDSFGAETAIFSFSFVCFLGIIAYHAYNKEIVKNILKKAKKAAGKKSFTESSIKIDENMSTDEARMKMPTVTSTVFDTSDIYQFREPLLDIKES